VSEREQPRDEPKDDPVPEDYRPRDDFPKTLEELKERLSNRDKRETDHDKLDEKRKRGQ